MDPSSNAEADPTESKPVRNALIIPKSTTSDIRRRGPARSDEEVTSALLKIIEERPRQSAELLGAIRKLLPISNPRFVHVRNNLVVQKLIVNVGNEHSHLWALPQPMSDTTASPPDEQSTPGARPTTSRGRVGVRSRANDDEDDYISRLERRLGQAVMDLDGARIRRR